MTSAATTHTRYEIRQSAAWITLDSPENRNALSAPLVEEPLSGSEPARPLSSLAAAPVSIPLL